ncbi:MAG: hypothetical protein ACYTEX_25905 [Planctomycetota bacterium]|jgi:hypothetical protein
MPEHPPEPWVVGCWQQVHEGRKLYYEFVRSPAEGYQEPNVYSGVKYGDRVHCSEWDRGKAPGEAVFDEEATAMIGEDLLRRIVACVNALDGVPTEVLEGADGTAYQDASRALDLFLDGLKMCFGGQDPSPAGTALAQ